MKADEARAAATQVDHEDRVPLLLKLLEAAERSVPRVQVDAAWTGAICRRIDVVASGTAGGLTLEQVEERFEARVTGE